MAMSYPVSYTHLDVYKRQIIAWAAGIVLFGSDGRQFDIFFRNTEDFFADITNVIGYSANRNTYVETYYLGACERAYPAIVYLMAYMLSRIIAVSYTHLYCSI